MRVAASTSPGQITDADRRVLAGCSGWGGLSIGKVKTPFPTGFPASEVRSLIHEYCTPSKVPDEVARVLRPLIPKLSGPDGKVLTLEPSAGIGRFIRSLSGPGFAPLRWNVEPLVRKGRTRPFLTRGESFGDPGWEDTPRGA